MNQSVIKDEDWSIISSLSDFEEDSPIASLQEEQSKENKEAPIDDVNRDSSQCLDERLTEPEDSVTTIGKKSPSFDKNKKTLQEQEIVSEEDRAFLREFMRANSDSFEPMTSGNYGVNNDISDVCIVRFFLGILSILGSLNRRAKSFSRRCCQRIIQADLERLQRLRDTHTTANITLWQHGLLSTLELMDYHSENLLYLGLIIASLGMIVKLLFTPSVFWKQDLNHSWTGKILRTKQRKKTTFERLISFSSTHSQQKAPRYLKQWMIDNVHLIMKITNKGVKECSMKITRSRFWLDKASKNCFFIIRSRCIDFLNWERKIYFPFIHNLMEKNDHVLVLCKVTIQSLIQKSKNATTNFGGKASDWFEKHIFNQTGFRRILTCLSNKFQTFAIFQSSVKHLSKSVFGQSSILLERSSRQMFRTVIWARTAILSFILDGVRR